MKKVKSFKTFRNNNEKSIYTEQIVKEKMIANGFVYNDKKYDLAIAIGGDASFLRMVKNNSFNSKILYVGINAGTLGFAQEVSIDDIDDFIEKLKNQSS